MQLKTKQKYKEFMFVAEKRPKKRGTRKQAGFYSTTEKTNYRSVEKV